MSDGHKRSGILGRPSRRWALLFLVEADDRAGCRSVGLDRRVGGCLSVRKELVDVLLSKHVRSGFVRGPHDDTEL